jgi:hypothetical protein
MKNFDFKRFFKLRKKASPPGPSLAWPINFVRDWKFIVLIFVIVLISLSLFAWQIYLSEEIAGGYLTSTLSTSTVSIKTINQKRLETDLSILEERDNILLNIKTTRPKMVDPAL